MEKRFTPPPWERPTQKIKLNWLILRVRAGKHVVSSIRILVTQRDVEELEPILQRLMRGVHNKGLSFEVKNGEVMSQE